MIQKTVKLIYNQFVKHINASACILPPGAYNEQTSGALMLPHDVAVAVRSKAGLNRFGNAARGKMTLPRLTLSIQRGLA
jgi:hypothetical protein